MERLQFVFVPLFLLGVLHTGAGEYFCPSGWSLHEHSCFKLFFDTKKWSAAQSTCESNGGHLAVISDQKTQDFLHSIIKDKSHDIWIGINDVICENSFHWLNRKAEVTYENWGREQPNNYNSNQDCGVLWEDGNDLTWADEQCSLNYRYLCQKPAGNNSPQFKIIPETVISNKKAVVEMSCKPGAFSNRNIQKLEIYQNSKKLLAAIDHESKITYKNGRHKRYKIKGLVDKDNAKTFLLLTLTNAKKRDTTTYTCIIHYLDESGVLKQDRSDRKLTALKFKSKSMWAMFDAKLSQEGKGNEPDVYRGIFKDEFPAVDKTDDGAFCPSGWSLNGVDCYKRFDDEKTWPDANSVCTKEEAFLATIRDEQSNNFLISNILSPNENFWIGRNDFACVKSYQVIDNSSSSYTNWAKGEPNHYSGDLGKRCVHIWADKNYTWADTVCTEGYFKFVCQRSADFHLPRMNIIPDKSIAQKDRQVKISCKPPFIQEGLYIDTMEIFKGRHRLVYIKSRSRTTVQGLNDKRFEAKGLIDEDNNDRTYLSLTIQNPQKGDSGDYRCSVVSRGQVGVILDDSSQRLSVIKLSKKKLWSGYKTRFHTQY